MKTGLVAAAVTMGVAASLVPAGAQAELYDGGRFTDSFVETVSECGFKKLVHVVDISVVYKLRTIVDDGQTEYLFQAIQHSVETYTNPKNGRWFTLAVDANHRETDGHHVEGTIWEFTAKGSGASFTVTDESGAVIFRDTGTYETTFLFETFGDDSPGGEVLSEELIDLDGRFSDWDWCDDVFEPLLG
ncbi:MAG TPA: hypothetical protein VLI04_21875 [Nocardioidaceae bacterium]|nr:hypothetical protein [Nocardioidaceae bacterium]